MEPKIIFEDEALLVVDKPAGMTVNRAETTKGEVTVQDWLEEKFKITSQNLKFTDFYSRAGIVHRLDKETSGLLLVAKTPEAFISLQQQFKERTVKKTYLALVHGEVKPGEGEIRVPVGRLPWNRKRFGVIAGGREAVTKYKILRYYDIKMLGKLTLLELYPETGRTHQLRVHLKYAGHPIFADPVYGGRKRSRDDRKTLARVFLHAAKISFTHPKTGENVQFESLSPKELTNIIGSI